MNNCGSKVMSTRGCLSMLSNKESLFFLSQVFRKLNEPYLLLSAYLLLTSLQPDCSFVSQGRIANCVSVLPNYFLEVSSMCISQTSMRQAGRQPGASDLSARRSKIISQVSVRQLDLQPGPSDSSAQPSVRQQGLQSGAPGLSTLCV